MKFKLLRGAHQEDGVTYSPGAVFNSKSNLLELNYVKNEPRFAAIPEEEPAPEPKADSLDGMTIEELRQFAAESEVDLGKARTKNEILAVLRSA